MIHDISGGETKIPGAKVTQGKDEKGDVGAGKLAGASVVCKNGTGMHIYDLHIHVKGLDPNKKAPTATVQTLDNAGRPTGSSWDQKKSSNPDNNGESDIDIDVSIDAGETFNITISHEAGAGKETKYDLVVTPTDAKGFPVN